MNRTTRLFYLTLARLFLCGMLSVVGSIASAETSAQSLLEAEKLAIKVWLEPEDNIIVTQQVNLNIEVSTHRWFVGGTRLGRLEVDNAIVLSRDSFAVNSSRRQGGENWAVQLWTMTLYPQRGGSFKVPSIPVSVTVSGEDNQPVEGVIYTDELTFEATAPVEVNDHKAWVATTLFEVNDQFDKDIAQLSKGDSVQRTIRFKAENIAAMMLPELSIGELDGVGVYPKPAVIEDTVNRGEYIAERTETINYIIEQTGEYRLPALTFYWWDLNSQQLQTAVIPERMLSTFGVEATAAESNHSLIEPISASLNKVLAFSITLIVILILAGIAVFAKRRGCKVDGKRDSARMLEGKFVVACQQQQYFIAVSLLYEWFDDRSVKVDRRMQVESIRQWLNGMSDRAIEEQFNQLMAAACSANSSPDLDINVDQRDGVKGEASVAFESLLKQLQQQSDASHKFFRYSKSVDLRLN